MLNEMILMRSYLTRYCRWYRGEPSRSLSVVERENDYREALRALGIEPTIH